jgi:hypothetical protein
MLGGSSNTVLSAFSSSSDSMLGGEGHMVTFTIDGYTEVGSSLFSH